MSSASAASSSTKKVEWYHLDRVALAKRICLDSNVKLKTALNTNNNNNYNGGGGGNGGSKSMKSIGNVTTTNTGNPTSVSLGTGNGLGSKGSASYDHHRLYPRPQTIGKEGLDPGNGGGSTVNGGSGTTVDPTKGIFALRFNTANIPSSPSSPTFTSAGSRQLLLQQQKRRRKPTSRLGGGQPQQQQQSPQRKRSFLDEDDGIINGATSVVTGGGGSSCGSSSRSSSSGVSSDFDELDTTSMKGTTAARNGHDQSSSSECDEEDEDGAPPINSSFGPKTTKGKGGISNSTKVIGIISAGVVGEVVASVGASGKGCCGVGGVPVCKGSSRTDGTRTVNGTLRTKGPIGLVSGGATKLISAKLDPTGTSPRCKHVAGSTSSSLSSHSSASSTTSGSTDNDRDTDISFSEFPSDLFLGVPDKGKRRTDRYDSSESSDSGVATLSPSTSESPELISTCDFTSDHLDVGNLISTSRSTSSSYPTAKSSSSSSSSSSSCSGSTVSSTEAKGGTTGASSTTTTSTSKIAATLPSSTGSSEKSSLATNPRVAQESTTSSSSCMWKGCACSTEASHNILEHIQTTHVAPQMKTVGYVCLWEGCKVFNKRSSSLSWLERHVLSHSGNKPYKCIFPGCGLSFSSQNALERHVNSHIATNGTTNAAQGNSTVTNKKLDASPAKASRRKKTRFRKQRVNIGQRVDFFDKRIMEVIKHWLASSVDRYAVNAHDCTFRGEVIARRVTVDCEPQLLVRWHPRHIFPDEWLAESKYSSVKLVPLRRIPSDRIRLLYPALFPPQRQEKGSRKRKPRFHPPPPSSQSTPARSEGSSSLTTLPPSPNTSLSSSPAAELPSFITAGTVSLSSSRNTRSTSSSSSVSSSCSTSAGSFSSSSSSGQNCSHSDIHSTTMMMMMDSSNCSGISSELEQEDNKCHRKFAGCSSRCDSPSALDDDCSTHFESSHWALEVLYEDLGISPS